MTNEEAMKTIKNNFGIALKASGPVAEVMQVCLEALEKQIPKKPTIQQLYLCVQYICPSCESYVGNGGNWGKYGIHKYCKECGQKIDWESGDFDE